MIKMVKIKLLTLDSRLRLPCGSQAGMTNLFHHYPREEGFLIK
jgi:hypothetical protein